MPLLDEPLLQPSVGGLYHSKKETLRISTLRQRGMGPLTWDNQMVPSLPPSKSAFIFIFSGSPLCLFWKQSEWKIRKLSWWERCVGSFLSGSSIESGDVLVVIPDFPQSLSCYQGLNVSPCTYTERGWYCTRTFDN